MAEDSRVLILYRVAEKQSKNTNKKKPDYINNVNCLANIAATKGDAELVVFGDNLKESKKSAQEAADKFVETKAHGNSETFLEVLQYALDNAEKDDIVYFVEDDYIHRDGWADVLREGFKRAEYISLYDHPDKYDGTPRTLFHTDSTHWQFVPSTTMTFATKGKTLQWDADVFRQLITTGNPPDHHIFSYLTNQLHRRLASPIPGWATHGETQFMSPVINWQNEV